MVPIATSVSSTSAELALVRLSRKVSSASNRVSLTRFTVTCWVSPALPTKVRVPLPASVKSTPRTASMSVKL